MNKDYPRINLMGECAILIDFEPEISENNLHKILFFKERIEKEIVKQNVEVTNTYHSLLITYQDTIEDIYSDVLAIKSLLKEANIGKKKSSTLFRIPVCYDSEFGLDMELISNENNLSQEEIIFLHTTAVYTVYFIGFLPGFLYLGGLDERLHISRKVEPRMKVAKGAVGIGGSQTGIYPKPSPGGWQILGRSPVPLFNAYSDPPVQIAPGDKVKFYAVSKSEYERISEDVTKGDFQFKKELYEN